MRVIVQRSKESNVLVNNKGVGKIDKGLVLLVGFHIEDTKKEVEFIVNKVLNLRIFDDKDGIMNLSIKDINGSILSISQFTLYGDTNKGNRPSYQNAMKGDKAIELYDYFNQLLKEQVNLEQGIFGAEMEVNISNDGPVTIILDSNK
ncbi:MAG: D-aminoacyl-tRNA deacylase [Bacilli bacterium]|nr:D-aminoacyl-tRNA deacylase [Bacilli bacterium]